MRALERRIRLLEVKSPPRETVSSLSSEIKVMTREERDGLKRFLEFIRDGGLPGESQYEFLKAAAEAAISAAHKRLSAGLNIAA